MALARAAGPWAGWKPDEQQDTQEDTVYEIHDEQTGQALSTGHPTVQEATDRLEAMLTEVREQVEATGDSVHGMVLEWEIREETTGRGVAWHYGAPVPLAGHG